MPYCFQPSLIMPSSSFFCDHLFLNYTQYNYSHPPTVKPLNCSLQFLWKKWQLLWEKEDVWFPKLQAGIVWKSGIVHNAQPGPVHWGHCLCQQAPLNTGVYFYLALLPKASFHTFGPRGSCFLLPLPLSGTLSLCCCPSLAILLGGSSYTQNLKLISRGCNSANELEQPGSLLQPCSDLDWYSVIWHSKQASAGFGCRTLCTLFSVPVPDKTWMQSLQLLPAGKKSPPAALQRPLHSHLPSPPALLWRVLPSKQLLHPCPVTPRPHTNNTQKRPMQPSPFGKLSVVDKFPARHFSSTKLQPMSLLALLTQVP